MSLLLALFFLTSQRDHSRFAVEALAASLASWLSSSPNGNNQTLWVNLCRALLQSPRLLHPSHLSRDHKPVISAQIQTRMGSFASSSSGLRLLGLQPRLHYSSPCAEWKTRRLKSGPWNPVARRKESVNPLILKMLKIHGDTQEKSASDKVAILAKCSSTHAFSTWWTFEMYHCVRVCLEWAHYT